MAAASPLSLANSQGPSSGPQVSSDLNPPLTSGSVSFPPNKVRHAACCGKAFRRSPRRFEEKIQVPSENLYNPLCGQTAHGRVLLLQASGWYLGPSPACSTLRLRCRRPWEPFCISLGWFQTLLLPGVPRSEQSQRT